MILWGSKKKKNSAKFCVVVIIDYSSFLLLRASLMNEIQSFFSLLSPTTLLELCCARVFSVIRPKRNVVLSTLF